MPDLQSRGALSTTVSTAIVQLFAEYTGRGPTRARTTIADDTVTVVLRDCQTKAEKRLIADGELATVADLRLTFQKTMREDLIGTVELLLERKVIAFMSGNDIEADISCEVFVLGPPSEA
jgi:uncharacterized protein YbcI